LQVKPVNPGQRRSLRYPQMHESGLPHRSAAAGQPKEHP
jgi:hypothetical protein